MANEEDIVPPPYVLEDVAPPPDSALSQRVSDFSFDSTYSHGLHLGRAPQLRPGLFVGRDSELKDLSLSLVPGSSTRKIVAIAAVGGLGKTQLAITYAERYHQKYSSVFWLDAKDEGTLKQELAGLADIVLEQNQITTASSVDEDSIIKQVKQWFSFQDNNRWLLVLDNYDDPKLPGVNSTTGYDIRSYFPSRNQGSILITTRSKKLSFAECLELKKLEDIAQGLQILSLRSGLDLAQNSGAHALASRLAGFPLALATAGAYIGQSSGECSAQEYLNLYDQQLRELKENADQLLEYEDRTLFSTWNLSLEHVREQHPAAADLLSFLAYLGNDRLNYELFRTARDKGINYSAKWLNALTGSKIAFNKAMATLQNYSLVEHSPQGWSLHTCVHDWTLQILNENILPENFWDAMLCVAANVPRNVYEADSWQTTQRLIQHAAQLWKLRGQQQLVEKCHDEVHAYSLEWVGNLWRQMKNFDKAEVLSARAFQVYENLFGSNNERTLHVMLDLAVIYKETDRLAEAENLYGRALDESEGFLAVDAPQRLRSKHNLALLYKSQDRFSEAELLLREVLWIGEVSCELDSHEQMQVASNLADVLQVQGKLPEAESISQRAMDFYKTTLGIGHPQTLKTMYVCAGVYFHQRKWELAEMLYKTVLEGEGNIYGLNHADTLETARSLGDVYLQQRRSEELVKLVHAYGNREPDLFWLLGCLYVANGDDREAVAAFRQVFRDYDGILSWPKAFCDGCQHREDLLTAGMGLCVCRTCDDIVLCYHCGEQHRISLKIFEHCAGHSFLIMTPEVLAGTSEWTEMPTAEQ